MNKTELLDQMRTGHDQLEVALAQLTDDQMTIPGLDNHWSVKDLLGHIGWWEQRVVTIFQTLRRGETPDGVANESVDDLNAKVYAENQARSLADVRRSEQQAYQELWRLVEVATEADLFHAQRFAWTQGKPFVNWIADNTYGHYDEHLPALRQWITTL